MFKKRIGPDPHVNGQSTPQLNGCPDILELECGDFAVIGGDITEEAKANMFPSAGCGPDERVIRIPRRILIDARRDIPEV